METESKNLPPKGNVKTVHSAMNHKLWGECGTGKHCLLASLSMWWVFFSRWRA